MKILAIETSCDDTGIAILEISGAKTPVFDVLANEISSQTEVHKKYGGVYPAMAKREHQRNLVPALIEALKKSSLFKKNIKNTVSSKLTTVHFNYIHNILERETELEKKLIPFLKKYEKPDIDLIAVTNGPGLEPCLWAGVNFAKALSYFWNIPIVPVNHIESHILVNFLHNTNWVHTKITFPAIALVVSGGHTQIILVKKIGKYEILGETRDDAAGECFDKCAKILGMNYPGGPAIAALAAKSEIHPVIRQGAPSNDGAKLPRPMINTKDYDFSFSGLKTAVLYAWQKKEQHKQIKQNSHFFATWQKTAQTQFAVEIQQAIIDVLLKKTIKAVKDYKAKTIILGGGVSANNELRRQFEQATEKINSSFLPHGKKLLKTNLIFPEPSLSTDNAVMTAITGYFHRTKKIATSDVAIISADGNLRIG